MNTTQPLPDRTGSCCPKVRCSSRPLGVDVEPPAAANPDPGRRRSDRDLASNLQGGQKVLNCSWQLCPRLPPPTPFQPETPCLTPNETVSQLARLTLQSVFSVSAIPSETRT